MRHTTGYQGHQDSYSLSEKPLCSEDATSCQCNYFRTSSFWFIRRNLQPFFKYHPLDKLTVPSKLSMAKCGATIDGGLFVAYQPQWQRNVGRNLEKKIFLLSPAISLEFDPMKSEAEVNFVRIHNKWLWRESKKPERQYRVSLKEEEDKATVVKSHMWDYQTEMGMVSNSKL